MKAGDLSKVGFLKVRDLPVAWFVATLLVLNAGTLARAQTAMGEIQDRPSPVLRCPSLPCAFPNVFNISVSVHFNATPAELTAIRNMISTASAVLFDATDGQAEIGEAFIYNNAFGTASDLRILRGPPTTGSFFEADTGFYRVGGTIRVSMDNLPTTTSPGEALAHEFVHLFFDARDEYESRPIGCPNGATTAACCPDAAAIAAGQTRCLMDGGGNGASSELCWGAGNSANLTDVSGGNHDATLVTEHSRCRANRSCWQQVVWSWPDHFTMPTGVPDPAANGEVVDPTQFVMADATVRVVLVLDESGSMSAESPSRIERLRVAAGDFVALAENGTELGIVSFSTDAEVVNGHANVAIDALDPAHRANCMAAITGLNPDGWTGIGLGLRRARNMIMTAGGVTANTFIVLMTDGINNRPLPDWEADLDAVLADLLADGIRVLVTCTGGDSGLASQCAEIAAATGGFSVDSANATDLPQAFTDFHERISGRESVDSVNARITTATPKKVFVEPGTDSVTFTLLWQDASSPATLTVIDPLGNSHASLPMTQGRFTRLSSPLAGDYLMVVTNQAPVSSNSTYIARAYLRHRSNSLSAAARYPTVVPGQPMYIFAYPRGLGGGITDPTNGITATVLLPDGQTNTLLLRDNGRGPNVEGDYFGGDGVFTGVFTNTLLKGAYRFTLRADMSNWVQSADGDVAFPTNRRPRFVREVLLSSSVGHPSDTAGGPRISINEWMAGNTSTLTNPLTGGHDDWFELYNPNPFPVNLSGWLLADSLSNSTPYVIPQGYIMAANAYRIVWADAMNVTNAADLHVDFRLSSAGETLALLSPDGRVVDHVTFGSQTNDISQGHSPDGGPYVFFFTTPTPGGPNTPMQTPVLRATASLALNSVTVSFSTVPGLTYRVEYKNSLNAPTWTRLAPAQVATGTSLSVPDTNAGGRQRFYRIVIVQ